MDRVKGNIEKFEISYKEKNLEYFVIDKLVSSEELIWIYHELIERESWSLSRTSNIINRSLIPFLGFPGLVIEDKGSIIEPYLSGWFKSLVFRISSLLKKEYNFKLPSNIKRIHVGAKSSLSRTEKHIDSENQNDWTILGFLNPIWNNKDGGEFKLNNTFIEYISGRFIVFPSWIPHDGGYIKNEKLNYWRISSNIILSEKIT